MSKILVKKSNPLKGSVKIDGAKNAVLPIIAATLLAKGKSTLRGVPNLKDVHVISDLLRHLGAEVEYSDNTLIVDATNIINPIVDDYDFTDDSYILDVTSKERGKDYE